MSDPTPKTRTLGPLLFAFAAVAGIALGACRQDDGDESDASLDVMNSCRDYCSQAKACKDEINEEKCRNGCVDTMTDCQVDEQDAALKKLDQCAAESCDDFLGCTIKVGTQCAFGI